MSGNYTCRFVRCRNTDKNAFFYDISLELILELSLTYIKSYVLELVSFGKHKTMLNGGKILCLELRDRIIVNDNPEVDLF